MPIHRLSTLLFCTAFGAGIALGCDRPKDPAEVREEVSEAREDANARVADARRQANEEKTEAYRSVVEETDELRDTQRDAADKVDDANR